MVQQIHDEFKKYRAKAIGGEEVSGHLTIVSTKFNDIAPGAYISNETGMPFAYLVIPNTVEQI